MLGLESSDCVMTLDRSVAAALSKAACREDVGWIPECTAWMDGSLKTVQLYSTVLENRQMFCFYKYRF